MTEIDTGTSGRALPPGRGGRRRWGVLGAIVAVGAAVWVIFVSGGDGSGTGTERAPGIALGPLEMAGATGREARSYQRTNPPVDVGMVEQAARGVTLGRVEMPDGREVVTYHDGTTGADVTQAILVYDDGTEAAELLALAAPLLTSSFDLDPAPITLDGTTDAQMWSADRYRAVTFRVDGVIVLVGMNRTGDDEALLALAGTLRDRARTAGATAAAVGATASAGPTAP